MLIKAVTDKMFNLSEVQKEANLQTDGKEEIVMLSNVPDSHFSKLMQRYVFKGLCILVNVCSS